MTDAMLTKKAEALRAQVMRQMGLTEWPEKLKVNWEDLVILVELHGTEAIGEVIESFRGTLAGAPDPEPR